VLAAASTAFGPAASNILGVAPNRRLPCQKVSGFVLYGGEQGLESGEIVDVL
jgi:hypothetical protein